MHFPSRFEGEIASIVKHIRGVEGFLRTREIEFLALLAACPTADGEILEIGSYFGKSTIALVKGAELGGTAKVIAVDPLMMAKGKERFLQNLTQSGVRENVEFHQMKSEELGRDWDRPLRLLWIDGDHSHSTTKGDFEVFAPHLVNRGIIAFHDVLNRFEGPLRVFMEQVLLSDRFGACGICGSIGWAQVVEDASRSAAHRKQKLRLYKQLNRLVPFIAYNNRPSGSAKIGHELFRTLVPSGRVMPKSWLKNVA